MSEFLYHAPCPDCGSSDALSVYTDGHTYCFSCGKTTRRTEKFNNMNFIDGAFSALSKRGLHLNTCKKFNYQTGTHNNTPVQIANYYYKNERIAQHIRYPDKGFSWIGDTKKVDLFGQHLWSSGGKRLVITEGEIDCLSIAQVFGLNWPVVSIPSGAKSAKKALLRCLEWVESFETIVLAFDDDPEGHKAVQEVGPLLTPGKVRVMSYGGYKDANEMLQAGKTKELGSAVFNAEPYRPDGIISGTDLWSVVNTDPVKGLDILYPKLSEMLFGFRKGELNLFTAGSGIGKSTLVHEIGYDLCMTHNQKLGIIALEDSLKKASERHMSIYLNTPLNRTFGVPEEKRKEAFDATIGNGRYFFYDHWGSTAIDNLLSKIRYMIVGLGVDWIILDHISIVVSGLDEIGESERRMIDKLMTRLRKLINETKVGVNAIVHLKRPETGKGFTEGRTPVLQDLRGSGSLEQLSDSVVAIERNQTSDDSNKSLIWVLKNREIGPLGKCDALQYNNITGRLLPIEEKDEPITEDF